jgi:hypothetical protein
MGPVFVWLPVRFVGRLFGRLAASIGLDNYMTDPAPLTRTPGPTPTSTATRQADDMKHPNGSRTPTTR